MRMDLENKLKTSMPLPSGHSSSALWESVESWLEKYGIYAFHSPREKELLEKTVGSWSLQEIVSSSWRSEALGVILWALELITSIPPYDTQFSTTNILGYLPLGKQPDEFVKKAKLRESARIAKARDLAELWHWRARTTRLEKGLVSLSPEKLPKGWTLRKIISTSATLAYKAGDIEAPIEDDIPLHGKAFGKLSEEEYDNCSSICKERHFALNWLNGQSTDWDNTRTDT